MKQRNSTDEIVAFSDAEANLALEEILRRRPHAVELERHFAATPRGAALINRIKADPTLEQSELRVVSHDGAFARVVPRVPGATPLTSTPAVAILEADAEVEPALDQRGTRRAPRFRIAGEMGVHLDGNAATLVDLSTVGAQVISPTIVKPKQRVRVALTDDHGTMRFNGAITWAFFEIPSNHAPHYRAGVDFVDADSFAVGAFCLRHKA